MSEDINRMSPESTNELLKKMRAITNDLWRESPDVAAETKEKAKKPENGRNILLMEILNMMENI